MGPVFGIRAEPPAASYAQVVPMEDINLHFTGDMHAIGAANNLLAAMLDNHIHKAMSWELIPAGCLETGYRYERSPTSLCSERVKRPQQWSAKGRRLRHYGASEIMAILCLAEDIIDLKNRLSKVIVAYTHENKPVTAGDLKAHGAMAAI